MKKVTIQINFEPVKMSALITYMNKKGANFDKEILDTLDKLYLKYVPPLVREYIEDTPNGTEKKTPKKVTNRAEPTQSKL